MNNTYKISGSLSNLFYHFPEEKRTEELYSHLLNKPITIKPIFGEKCIGIITAIDVANDSFIGYLFDNSICLEVYDNTACGIFIR